MFEEVKSCFSSIFGKMKTELARHRAFLFCASWRRFIPWILALPASTVLPLVIESAIYERLYTALVPSQASFVRHHWTERRRRILETRSENTWGLLHVHTLIVKQLNAKICCPDVVAIYNPFAQQYTPPSYVLQYRFSQQIVKKRTQRTTLQ